jgi:hypothetical protein
VVFQGSFLAATNPPPDLLRAARFRAGQAPSAPPPQNETFRYQSFPAAAIQGQAVIGGSNRMEINAAPVLRSE